MIDQYPSANGVLTSLIWRKTAAGGETSLSGYDDASQALSYTPGQEQVYLNGILLVRGDDYTATNGTSITGLTALAANDFVQINCYNNFSVASVPTTSLVGTVANGNLPSSSTSASGIVQLTDSTSSSSTTTAATPNSVKTAYDLANAAIPKTLTTTTGDIIYASSANTPSRLGIGSNGNILTVSGGIPAWTAPATAGSYTLISTTTLPGNASEITLSSIPNTYKDLKLIWAPGFNTSPNEITRIACNGDTSSVYTEWSFLNSTGGGTSFGSQKYIDQAQGAAIGLGFPTSASSGGGTYNIVVWEFLDYANTTTAKLWNFIQYFHTTNRQVVFGGGIWPNTSAISSIRIRQDFGSMNGTIRLFGIA